MSTSSPRWTSLLSLLLLVLVLSMSGATRAHADGRVRAHLTWQRPLGTTCPSGSALQSDIEQLTGTAVFAPQDEADLLVRGIVQDGASGVRIEIDARDKSGRLLGTRELSAPAGECHSLRRAVGVVLALLLDQNYVAPQTADEAQRARTVFGASFGVLTGTLPRADAGLGLALSLAVSESLRVRADTSYWLPVIAQTGRGVGATFRSFRAGLSLCPRLWSSALFGVWLCTGVQLGGLHSTPRNLAGRSHQARLLVQPSLELAATLQLSRRSAVEVAVGGLANVLRPSFEYGRRDGERAGLHRPDSFGGLLRVSVSFE